MPKDDPNGKKPPPPESLYFERSQVKCQRCGKLFEHFIIEVIDDLSQLRCGDVVISHLEMVCLHCGHVFHWSVKDKKLEQMALTYSELTAVIKRYKAE